MQRIALLVATLGYAIGTLIVKNRLSAADPLGPVTAALAIAAIMLLPFGILDMPWSASVSSSLAKTSAPGLSRACF